MAEVVKVEINGTEYYCGADQVQYIEYEDNYIFNTSGSTITLYGSLREYGNNYSGYPRITIGSYQKAYITQSYNSGYQTLNVSSYEVLQRKFSDTYMLSLLIFGVLVLMLFKKR